MQVRRDDVLCLPADLLEGAALLGGITAERLARIHLVTRSELGRGKAQHTRLSMLDPPLELWKVRKEMTPFRDRIIPDFRRM